MDEEQVKIYNYLSILKNIQIELAENSSTVKDKKKK